MRSVSTSVLTAGLVLLAASPAFAQPRPGGFFRMMQDPNTYMLLRGEKVQDELKLTDEQKADLKKVVDKYGDDIRTAFMGMDFKKAQELMKSASDDDDKVLKPDQMKRINQLKVQAAGLYAFGKDDVVTALKLTDKQKKDIAGQKDDLDKNAKDLFDNAQGDQDKMRDAFRKVLAMRKEAVDKVVDGLNDDQKKAWKELTGDKFEFDFGPPRRPGNDR
jgi:Spy/CpxP family protein refolding chaperone